MALVLRYLGQGFKTIFFDYTDERIARLPMMTSSTWIFGILASYLYFVKVLGPKMMANRQPFDLKYCLMAYNFVQVVANFGLAVFSTLHTYFQPEFKIWCTPFLPNDHSERSYTLAFCAYLYLVLKVVDLMDTVFFVMRKRYKQVSFLHIYHHAMMAFTSYYFVKHMLIGHVALMPIINLYVHGIMYGYYFLTSFKPELKQSLWWKKHITQIQLLQFFVLFIHFGRPLIMRDCSYYPMIVGFCFLQNFFMIAMFSDFYIKAYVVTKDRTQTKKGR